MNRIIINSDDFGLSKGVNEATIKACKLGALYSTTALVGAPDIMHAVKLSKDCYDLNIGIHLSFDYFKCFSKHPDLMNEDGNLINDKSMFKRQVDVDVLVEEFDMQIKEFKHLFNKLPTHIDSHHHAHLESESCMKAALIIADRYNLPIRGLNGSYVSDSFYDNDANLDKLKEIISSFDFDSYDNLEIMVHVAFSDDDLRNRTSYNDKRNDEYDVLTSNEFSEYLKNNKIKIGGYHGK